MAAFTADKLTDLAFSLRAGKNAAGEPGYFVERDKNAEDSARLGAAAMLHLYHSDPNRFTVRASPGSASTGPPFRSGSESITGLRRTTSLERLLNLAIKPS